VITRKTVNCSKYGHDDVSMAVDDTADEAIVNSVIANLTAQVAAGKYFQPGETIQIGCGILRFERAASGGLELWEPDYRSFPVVFRPQITATIRQLSRQSDTSHSVPEGLFQRAECPSILQSAIVCSEFSTPASGYMMKRDTASGNDSGWFIGCLGNHDHQNPANLVRESLYRVLLSSQDLADFLHLPSGCAVQYCPGKFLVLYDEQMEPITIPHSAPIRRNYPYIG
jgi:hypothetical protein